jgi:hypothetical protein
MCFDFAFWLIPLQPSDTLAPAIADFRWNESERTSGEFVELPKRHWHSRRYGLTARASVGVMQWC